MIRSILSAFSFLTILPVRAGKISEPEFSSAPAWFPLTGFFLGSICLGMAQLLSGKIPAQLISFFILVFLAMITGGLHLDGLADWADSFAGRNPEQRLKIMKDSHHGSFGIIAIVLVLLGKFVAFNLLLENDNLLMLALAPGLARLSLTLILGTTPYARSEGGAGTLFAQGKKKWHLALAIALGILPLITLWAGQAPPLLSGITGWISLGIVLILSFLFRWDGIRRLGGFTGDLLGASVEVCELAVLFSAALVAKIF